MSGQRARSAVSADHRSAHPDFPGVPWWAAVLIALTTTAVGFAFDAGSGNKELSSVFAVCYVLGCLAAVLAVRQSGIFTAVIQPPLVLFVTVPGSYFLFHYGQLSGLKDLAINCGYPLIERFPLMFFTSAAVLLIGMARWYLGMSARRTPTQTDAERPAAAAVSGLLSTVTAKLTALIAGRSAAAGADEADAIQPRRRKHSATRSGRPAKAGSRQGARAATGNRSRTKTAKAAPRAGTGSRSARPRSSDAAAAAEATGARKTTRSRRTTKRAAPPQGRHGRPTDTGRMEPVAERPRRSRSARQGQPPVPPNEPRRSRSQSANEPRRSRSQPPPDRRTPYGPYDSYEPRPPRPRRPSGFDGYEPLEPHGGANSTRHPVSRVRYRTADDMDGRAEYRSRPRHARREADSWE